MKIELQWSLSFPKPSRKRHSAFPRCLCQRLVLFLVRDLHWIISGKWRMPHVSGALLVSILQAGPALLAPEMSAEHSCGLGREMACWVVYLLKTLWVPAFRDRKGPVLCTAFPLPGEFSALWCDVVVFIAEAKKQSDLLYISGTVVLLTAKGLEGWQACQALQQFLKFWVWTTLAEV